MSALCWFEIPCSDFERATAFYEAVFDAPLQLEDIGDGTRKSIFLHEGSPQGAVSWGSDWTPSDVGVVVYFDAGPDLQVVLDRVVTAGGAVVEPKQAVDATSGFWGRFRDTEGNLIGVLSPQ